LHIYLGAVNSVAATQGKGGDIQWNKPSRPLKHFLSWRLSVPKEKAAPFFTGEV
jgi:hypothetical protein